MVYHTVDSLTKLGHEEIIKHYGTLIILEPLDLLLKHRNLPKMDFVELGEDSRIDRQY